MRPVRQVRLVEYAMRVQFFQFQRGQRDCRQVEPVRQVRLVEHVVRVQFSNFKGDSVS